MNSKHLTTTLVNLKRDTSLTTGGGTKESGKIYPRNFAIPPIEKVFNFVIPPIRQDRDFAIPPIQTDVTWGHNFI